MANAETFRNLAIEVLEREPVTEVFSTVQTELPVPANFRALPLPAPIAHQNLVEKADRNLVQHGMMVQQGGAADDNNCLSVRS